MLFQMFSMVDPVVLRCVRDAGRSDGHCALDELRKTVNVKTAMALKVKPAITEG